MRHAGVRTLKAVLPPRLFGYLRTYANRLSSWFEIANNVRGTGPLDRLSIGASVLASPFTSLAGLGDWRDPVLLHGAQVDVVGVGRFNLRPRTDDLWHVLPSREPAVFRELAERLRPGDVFVDAGANIGFYSVLAAKLVGPQGYVIAVEMTPNTAASLRAHVAMNDVPWVRVIENALSSEEGESVTAHVPRGYYGQAALGAAGSESGSFQVTTTTLDAILRDFDRIDLVKLDIEGAELRALRGAKEALKRVRAVVFEHLSSDARDEVSALLRAAGFQVRRLSERDSIAERHDGTPQELEY